MKHNWKALKTAYITGDIKTVSEFADINGIPQNTISKHTSGWLKEKAEYMQNICNKTEEKLKEKEVYENVISAQERKEVLSDYIKGAVEQWKRLRAKLIEVEEAMKGQPANMKMLQELRRAYSSDTKILPDLLRAMELLDGGATSRTDTIINGKRTKDMSEQELYDAEREEAKRILERDKKEGKDE